MKYLKKLLVVVIALGSGFAAQAQSLDSGPANAQAPKKALLVAVPVDGNQADNAIVLTMDLVAGVDIKTPSDILKNQTAIAQAIEQVVTSPEAQKHKDLGAFLASKALKSEDASDLKSRDAWFGCYYRPNWYGGWGGYNPFFYSYMNYTYFSFYQPAYYYGGFNIFYYC